MAVDGWTTPDWDGAIADVERLHAQHHIGELYVGARCWTGAAGRTFAARPVGMTEARAGLAVFRDLAATQMLAHEDTTELDSAIVRPRSERRRRAW